MCTANVIQLVTILRVGRLKLRITGNVGTRKSQRRKKVSHEVNAVAGLSSKAINPRSTSTHIDPGSETSSSGLLRILHQDKYRRYHNKTKTTNSVALVRKRTIPTERPPLSAKLVPTLADRGCLVVSATNPHGR
jgi:hypothetical protein